MNEGAGDWICSDQSCGNINFARRVSCYRCNKDRPDSGKQFKKKLGTEIGKSAAEKSRGLFNADDWQCNKCANVNWARRTTCNVCNAPKFGEVEARTGYGGGYNERGVVEYRRREPSSDDEYDEFGRKKRKRKPEMPNAVGITEGPLVKKLPPTLLQMELNMDAKEDPAPNVSLLTNKDSDKIRASLSDSSISELPPLSRMAFRRHQLQNQTNYHRQNHMLPAYKTNGNYLRKRFTSSTDQDIKESTENPPKRPRHFAKNSPVAKSFDGSTGNPLQPSKDDVVYKFTAATPTANYEVTYSIEERVKVAAFAIVHNNCKISTEKFESLYDKPAPDFKTIFAWRQRLLTSGCLIDTHISPTCSNKNKTSHTKPQPNPDEIPISSDSDTECVKTKKKQSNTLATTLQRSTSAETLVICNSQKASGSSASTAEDRAPQPRNHSSPRFRHRSSSRDTQDSNYPDSDLDKGGSDPTKCKTKTDGCDSIQKKQSAIVSNSESDSISYDSDYIDFLSRVYGEGKKPERKLIKRQTALEAKPKCQSNDVQIFQGYCTVKKSEQSPLATGNIYTANVRNMQAKGNTNFIDAEDNCMAEYVPTKLGSSTIKNYQDFKNNVKKKGFWAKGNCATFQKNKQPTVDKIRNDHDIAKVPLNNVADIPLLNSVADSDKELVNDISGCVPEQLLVEQAQGVDFTNDDFEQIAVTDNYTSFDKPLQTNDTVNMLQSNETTIVSPENSSRIFDLVQSDAGTKNRSIMEIFDHFDDRVSPDRNSSEKTTSKPYTLIWDEDDDALYNDSDDVGVPSSNSHNTSPGSFESQFLSTNNLLFGFGLENQDRNSAKYLDKSVSGDELVTKCSSKSNSPHKHIDTRSVLSQVIQPHSVINGNMLSGGTPDNQVTQTELLEKETSEVNNQNLPSQSKTIQVIESITLTPEVNNQEIVTSHNSMKPQSTTTTVTNSTIPLQNVTNENINSLESTQIPVNLSNILAGINTDTLLLALKNLQQITQNPEDTNNPCIQNGQTQINDVEGDAAPMETINLTNDEDWEKESDKEGSVERQLKRIHGNTGDTPFLSDIFDPGPVIIPPNVAKKLNINLQQNGDNILPDTNENTPVIGNFKSFALPKPIMLNRLKLTIKQADKITKHTADGRKRKRKRKSKAPDGQEEGSGAAEAPEEGDEEESGDEADLSKYDLWGSDDDENPRSSKPPDSTDKSQDQEEEKEGGSEEANKNGKAAPVENKTTKRRSRSSSSSSTSSSSSSSSHSSAEAPKNKFDDFNLNSERESPPGSPTRRSRSPHARAAAAAAPPRRKRDSRDSRGRESSRDKDRAREHERRASRASRERARPERAERKERRYSRDAAGNYFGARGRHR